MGVGQPEGIDQAVAPAAASLMSSWQKSWLRVATRSLTASPTGVAELNAPMVFPRAPFLFGKARRGDAQGAYAAFRGIEFGARRRDGDPHRRMGALQRLRQHGPLRHREADAVVGIARLGPHLWNGAHELIPSLLGVVRIHLKSGQLGPSRGAGSTELQPPSGQQIQHRRALRHPNGVVHFRHADHRTMANPNVAGLHGASRKKQLRRRAVGILLQKVMLHRPSR